MHLAYPNVQEGQFRACVRYRSFPPDQASDLSYRPANPRTPNLRDIHTAAEVLVPERTGQVVQGTVAQVFELADAPGIWQGTSLDFAYLLAFIRCSRPLLLETLGGVGDVWCTGEIGIREGQPELRGVEQPGFDAKLAGFLAQPRDRLFLVPSANVGAPQSNLCRTHQVQVCELATFCAALPGILTAGVWPEPMVVLVGSGEVRRLAAALFQLPPPLSLHAYDEAPGAMVIDAPTERPADRPQGKRDRRQQHLLDAVKSEVAGRLAQSLPHAGLMNLRKETRPQEVDPPWSAEVVLWPPPSALLPPETGIVEIFDQRAIAGRFLLLGAPGAGKTTLLLHLASVLLARAEADPEKPIPVLVNLSSWKDEHQPLASWLVAELKSKYGVRQDLGQHWLEEICLAPLLDGLDELEATHQELCVQAINQFLQGSYKPLRLVVCCRLEECQHCPTKLQLNGAVHLLPFTEEQIHQYLIRVGHPDLWPLLQAQTEWELAQSPLFLSLMTLAYEKGLILKWPRSSCLDEHHQYLFTKYIECMLSSGRKNEEYSKEKTVKWLGWLAKKMTEQSQTEFLIEKLQPTCLQYPTQQYMYHIGSIMITALIVGPLYYLMGWLLSFLPKGEYTNSFEELVAFYTGDLRWQYIDWVVPIMIGLIAGLIVGLRRTITPIETLKWSGAGAWRGMWHGLRRWTMTALAYGPYVGLMAGLIIGMAGIGVALSQELAIWGKVGSIAGGISGVIVGVVAVLTARPNVWWRGGVRERLSPRAPRTVMTRLVCGQVVGGILRQGSLVGGTLVGLLGGLGGGLISWVIGDLLLRVLRLELAAWLQAWLLGGLGVGATAGLIAGLLAMLSEKATPVNPLRESTGERWNWAVLGVSIVAVALVGGLSVVLLAGLGQIQIIRAIRLLTGMWGVGLSAALLVLLIFALGGAVTGVLLGAPLGALLGVLRGGLTGPEIERRATPNQGIRQSAVNVGTFVLIGGLTLGPIWGLMNEAAGVLMTGLTPTAADWWRMVLGNGLFLGLFSGLVPGAACLQHFTLRFVLWCHGVIPWHYVRFLNYATDRRLLQRVGGSYRFLHPLLKDHFAVMPNHSRIPRYRFHGLWCRAKVTADSRKERGT
jgi:hypothetical protein